MLNPLELSNANNQVFSFRPNNPIRGSFRGLLTFVLRTFWVVYSFFDFFKPIPHLCVLLLHLIQLLP